MTKQRKERGSLKGKKMRYEYATKFGVGFLTDEDGNRIIQLMPVSCTKSFLKMAGKELANKLNTIEQSKRVSVARSKWFSTPPDTCRDDNKANDGDEK